MARTKRGVTSHQRHKKVLKLAKGYEGRNNSCYQIAVEKVEKGLQYAYRDRKARKREYRALWIARINAAARMNDISYSQMMNGLIKAGILLDRKMLAELAVNNPSEFTHLATAAKAALQ